MKLDIHELMDPALRKPIGDCSLNSRTSADREWADEGWLERTAVALIESATMAHSCSVTDLRTRLHPADPSEAFRDDAANELRVGILWR